MQYFNRSNSEVEYIKNLVRDNYIPTVRFFNSEVNLQPVGQATSVKYSTGRSAKRTTLAEISSLPNTEAFEGETIIYNNSIFRGNGDNYNSSATTSEFKYISSYIFGKRYRNITTNFISNKNYYDYTLHEYLGRYLRAYRDYYRIDVMNFYNCFSCRYINSFLLPFNSYSDLISYDDKYKVAAFPIQYDTEYTITFSNGVNGDIILQAIYFNGTVPLEPAEMKQSGTTEEGGAIYTADYMVVPASGTIKVTIGSGGEKSKIMKQNLLYLFMQYPMETTGHITVLEQPKFTTALNNELTSLDNASTQQVAFSDTLLEYLTGAVISPATTIHASVAAVQDIIFSQKFVDEFGVGGPDYVGAENRNYKPMTGVFDETMHRIIYNAFFDYATNLGVKISSLTSIVEEEDEPDDTAGGGTESGTDSDDGTEGKTKEEYLSEIGYERIPNFIGYVDKNVETALLKFKKKWGL